MARTLTAGNGQCPQCGKQGSLHKCAKCGRLACFSCWQKSGGFSKPCPACGTQYKPDFIFVGLTFLNK